MKEKLWKYDHQKDPMCVCENVIVGENMQKQKRCMLMCYAVEINDSKNKPFPVYFSATDKYDTNSKHLSAFVFSDIPKKKHYVRIITLIMNKSHTRNEEN